MAEHRSEQMDLPDGRRLAWSEYGPVAGRPVLYFHGGNDCGREAAWFAGSLPPDVRIIAPDRPGFGGSTYQPARRFADVVPDVHAVLDQLQLERLPAFGLSGGGPHVLSLAALSDRVSRVAVVASPCPLESRSDLRGVWFPIRVAYFMARHAPDWILFPLQRAMNDPERNMQYSERMPAPDAALFREDPSGKQRVIESVSLAHAQGFEGAVLEWRLYVTPWGVDLRELRVPTSLWYGEADGMAPPGMGRRLATLIPHARLTVVPNEAHLSWIHRHAAAIVEELLEPDGQDAEA